MGRIRESFKKVKGYCSVEPKGLEANHMKEGTTEQNNTMCEFFGKPNYTYTSEEAVEDGVLAKNFRQDQFQECNLITSNLYEKIKEVATQRSMTRVFEISEHELLGCLMVGGRETYEKGEFTGDQDKDFFVMPATEEGTIVWFVRNEQGKLTAMLPGDY